MTELQEEKHTIQMMLKSCNVELDLKDWLTITKAVDSAYLAGIRTAYRETTPVIDMLRAALEELKHRADAAIDLTTEFYRNVGRQKDADDYTT